MVAVARVAHGNPIPTRPFNRPHRAHWRRHLSVGQVCHLLQRMAVVAGAAAAVVLAVAGETAIWTNPGQRLEILLALVAHVPIRLSSLIFQSLVGVAEAVAQVRRAALPLPPTEVRLVATDR